MAERYGEPAEYATHEATKPKLPSPTPPQAVTTIGVKASSPEPLGGRDPNP